MENDQTQSSNENIMPKGSYFFICVINKRGENFASGKIVNNVLFLRYSGIYKITIVPNNVCSKQVLFMCLTISLYRKY